MMNFLIGCDSHKNNRSAEAERKARATALSCDSHKNNRSAEDEARHGFVFRNPKFDGETP